MFLLRHPRVFLILFYLNLSICTGRMDPFGVWLLLALCEEGIPFIYSAGASSRCFCFLFPYTHQIQLFHALLVFSVLNPLFILTKISYLYPVIIPLETYRYWNNIPTHPLLWGIHNQWIETIHDPILGVTHLNPEPHSIIELGIVAIPR